MGIGPGMKICVAGAMGCGARDGGLIHGNDGPLNGVSGLWEVDGGGAGLIRRSYLATAQWLKSNTPT